MASDIFDLQGTAGQNAIVEDALRRCTFPFERLSPKLKADTGRERIPCEWTDLSRYAAQIAAAKASNGHAHIHEDGDTGHPIEVRERVLGLAWYSGKITLDLSLEQEVELAAEVAISEIAHMIDFFLMTDEQRQAIFNAMHGSENTPAEHGHDWFDVGPYNSWAGEAWMGLFVRAFSDVQMTMPFAHPVTPYAIQRAREILTPVPIPPQPELPDPDPGGEVFGVERSRVFHGAHAGIRRERVWPDAHVAEAAGRRSCKVCRPHNH